jgi:hypothetical protein
VVRTITTNLLRKLTTAPAGQRRRSQSNLTRFRIAPSGL